MRKKLLFMGLFFLLIPFSIYAFSYDEKEKEGLRAFLRQPSAVTGRLNFEYLGLELADTTTWHNSETWIGNLSGVHFIQNNGKYIIDGIFWVNCKLSGRLDCSSFANIKSLYIPNNQISRLNVVGCDSLSMINCDNNQFMFSDLLNIDQNTQAKLYYGSQHFINAGESPYDMPVDLTHQYDLDGTYTKYMWVDSIGNIINVIPDDYQNGLFTFTQEQIGKTLTCLITNQRYPGLTIKYQVKVADLTLQPVFLTNHLSIPDYKCNIPSGQAFEVHMKASTDTVNISLGLYTYVGAFLTDIVTQKTSDSTYICTIPNVGNGLCVIQPYFAKKDGTRQIIRRIPNSYFIDKLPVSVYSAVIGTKASLVIDQTVSASRHMRLSLANTDYRIAKMGETFNVYIATGQKTTSIGIFNVKGQFYQDIVQSSYGDNYTCTISNPNLLGDFIIMPYRKENGQIKIIEREDGSDIIDRLPLRIESNYTVNTTARNMIVADQPKTSVEPTIYLDNSTSQIYVKGLSEKASIAIYNLLGTVVYQSNLITDNINVQDLPSGIYIVRITKASGGTLVTKVRKT